MPAKGSESSGIAGGTADIIIFRVDYTHSAFHDGVGMGTSIIYIFSTTPRGLPVATINAHAALSEGPAILTIIAETNWRILSIGQVVVLTFYRPETDNPCSCQANSPLKPWPARLNSRS